MPTYFLECETTQMLRGEDMSNKWDHRFIELANHIAQWSKDPSTKVGCVIVGEDREIRSTGFNGFPRGINDDEERLNNRDLKYPLICHAEENAIMHAARIGVSLKGSSAYVTWPPCSRCARSLIQAGISEVIYYDEIEIPERWSEDFKISSEMFNESGVVIRKI
jgi:dCMP deaminase|tara:strand:+ start:266 stop:757 length:492 start_codon:yes stop_codon:yes gene_type:complete